MKGPRAFASCRWILPVILAFAGLKVAAGRGATAKQEEQVRLLNSHFHVEQAALSPDGERVAFVLRGGEGFEVAIHDTAQPGKKTEVRLVGTLTAPDYFAWASPGQLVILGTSLQVVDARTGRARKLADPAGFWKSRALGREPPKLRVLGFGADDPSGLLLEVANDAPDGTVSLELYRLDLVTGVHVRKFSRELGRPGGSFILDHQGRVRLVFARDTVPQRFLYLEPDQLAGEKDLDRVLLDHTTFAFRVTPENFLGERTIPLGFAGDPNLLYFATNRGQDTYALQAVDLHTGRSTALLAGNPENDLVDFISPWLTAPLVIDRARHTLAGLRINDGQATRWLDPAIAAVESALVEKFPGRSVQLVEWDAARERFLVLVSSVTDPGRYFVHDLRTGRSTEYYRKLPRLDPDLDNPANPVVMAAPTGGQLRLFLTAPHGVAAAPPPLVVWLHDGPFGRGTSGFNRDAQALAAQGFAVLEPDYAGTTGEGRARRELIRKSPDRVPLDEVLAAMNLPAFSRTFDATRVVLVGEGYGGYLALRALQLYPDKFRGAVAINAVTDLADVWRIPVRESAAAGLGSGGVRYERDPEGVDAAASAAVEASIQRLSNLPVARADFTGEFARWMLAGGPPPAGVSVTPQADRLTRPLLLMHDPHSQAAPFASLKRLRAELKKLRREPPYFELSEKTTRADLILRVGEFVREQTAAAAAP